MITREALRVLENNLTFTKFVSREYDDSFGKKGAKIGTTLNVRKPPRYIGRTGANLNLENSTETQVPITLNTQRGVDISFNSQDLALSIDDFSARFIKPAIASVANAVDYDGLQLYKKVYNLVGTPGTVPNSLTPYLSAGVALDNTATPRDGDRSVVVTPQMQANLVGALTNIFNPTKTLSDQYKTGTMGEAVGFKFSMDQNVGVQTIGALGGTPLVNGASQTGSTLATKGWTASTAVLNAGDVFTIAGVFGLNPQNHQTTGTLQQFVALSSVTSDGSGNASISISPAIDVAGTDGFATVTASPANSAAITIYGAGSTSTPQGLAFHKNAFTLACADLPLPGGVDMAARISDPQLGLSVRMVRAYSISDDTFPCRLDILYGWAALRPELAVRIAS